jgi:hypothetical protein
VEKLPGDIYFTAGVTEFEETAGDTAVYFTAGVTVVNFTIGPLLYDVTAGAPAELYLTTTGVADW